MTTTRREHDLLLCIARRDLDERRQTELRRLLSAALDWPYLMSAARRHGLMPLLYRHLNGISKEVPSTYFAAIKQESIENCQAVLTLLGRLTAVFKLFNQQNLPVLVFKGPVLADIAYGDNSFRQAGDIDVLAWHEDGRVMLLECKDLQFAKTPSEIAKQLSKFRGQMDEKGRPDLLAKHLKRVALATEHKDAFRAHLNLSGIAIDGALVFAHTVPMSFAAERIGHSVTLLTYDQLEPFFRSAH